MYCVRVIQHPLTVFNNYYKDKTKKGTTWVPFSSFFGLLLLGKLL